MSGVFQAAPAAMQAFSAASQAAAATITSAGSVDSEAILAAAAVTIGPIGAGAYHPALAQAVCHNIAATLLVAHVHSASGAVTNASNAAFVAADNA